ncbi:MAG: helix-turn-helix domain-containing protein [Chloroflexota bacterium]
MTQRLFAVMEIVDEVAFRRLDVRVAELLLARSQKQNPIVITHHEIAAELGSSREVISRILETFTRQNVIHVGRGAIEVIDSQVLRTFASR